MEGAKVAERRPLTRSELYGEDNCLAQRLKLSGVVPGLCAGLGLTAGLLLAGLAVYDMGNSSGVGYRNCVREVNGVYQESDVSHEDYVSLMDECSVYLGD